MLHIVVALDRTLAFAETAVDRLQEPRIDDGVGIDDRERLVAPGGEDAAEPPVQRVPFAPALRLVALDLGAAMKE